MSQSADSSQSSQVNSVMSRGKGGKHRKQHGQGTPKQKGQGHGQTSDHPEPRLKFTCGNCGTKHSKGNSCPAEGKLCYICKKRNHFAKCCRSRKKGVNEVVCGDQIYESDTDTYDFVIDTIDTDKVNKVKHDQAFASVAVGPLETHIEFKIDTGSQVNVLPLYVLNKLDCKVALEKSERKLSGYNDSPLITLGKCTLKCKYAGRIQNVEFYVVDTKSAPIFGLRSCLSFDIIKLVYSVQTRSTEPEVKSDTFPLTKTSVLKQHADVFKGIGKFAGEYDIQLDPTVPPVVNPPRRVPIALRDRLKSELDRMEDLNIIVKVTEPTRWVNSLVVVEKPHSDKLRICLDPQSLNRAILRPHYPSKSFEDILPKLANAKFFTKLDARSGYWAIQLSLASSLLTTFNTPFGRYRYLRLPFGLNSSQDEFQRRIDEIYEGLPGIVTIVDDLLVFGATREEHDSNLHKVMQRSRERGVKLNIDKLEVGVPEVRYFGHILSDQGLKPDPDKIAAITQMEPPRNRAELETVLGMTNYLSRFAPDLAEITSPMRALLNKKYEFVWDQQQDAAFQKVKDTLSASQVLAYFDPQKEVTLQVDASKSGLGATLLQEGRPVAYASKSLTPAEINYAQIEKETYAILFGCKRFHQYVYGRRIKVQSDHKPLESIFKKPLCAAPPRLQRMLLQLQRYDVVVTHVSGKEIPVADTLSRKYLPETYPSLSQDIDFHVHAVISQIPITDSKMSEIRKATDADTQLTMLKQYILNGWPDKFHHCPESIQEYWTFRDELSVESGIILKGTQVVIPKSLRESTLENIHYGHMGVEKCLKRARDTVFWPRISKDISDMVLNCTVCLERRNSNQKEPLMPHPVPNFPWQIVGTDLFTWNDQNFLVVVDYYSRYLEVEKLTSTSSTSVINKLKGIFSRQGVPQKVVSDNGPQYSSAEFEKFAKEWDFLHSTSSPHFAQSNGLAERTVQTIKHIFDKAKADRRDPYIGLLEYRTTKLDVGYSPSELLMGRSLRSFLPVTDRKLLPWTPKPSKVRERISAFKEKGKKRFDKGSKFLSRIKVGDSVRFKHPGKRWQPAVCVDAKGERSYVIRTPDGATYRRNRRHLIPTDERLDINPPSYDAVANPVSHTFPKIAETPASTVTDPQRFASTPTKSSNVQQLPCMESVSDKSVSHLNNCNKESSTAQPYVTRSGRVVKKKTIYSP